jgi:hypothetical protein
MKKNRRFGRDEWTDYFGLAQPSLDLASSRLAHASGVGLGRSTGLIDRPRDLIETPRRP